MVLAAGQAARRHAQPRVGQQRRRQQAALQPGVLLGVDLRHLQGPLRFLRAPPLDRVPDDPVQLVPGDLALDQVVLGSGPDRLLPQVLARLAGQHHDGRLRLELQQLPEPVQALRIRQAQVEEHAGRIGDQGLGLGERPRAPHHDRGAHLAQQLADQQGVAVVVLDEQDLYLIVAGGRGRGLEFSVTCHRNLHRWGELASSAG